MQMLKWCHMESVPLPFFCFPSCWLSSQAGHTSGKIASVFHCFSKNPGSGSHWPELDYMPMAVPITVDGRGKMASAFHCYSKNPGSVSTPKARRWCLLLDCVLVRAAVSRCMTIPQDKGFITGTRLPTIMRGVGKWRLVRGLGRSGKNHWSNWGTNCAQLQKWNCKGELAHGEAYRSSCFCKCTDKHLVRSPRQLLVSRATG